MVKFLVLLVVGGLLYNTLKPLWNSMTRQGYKTFKERRQNFDKKEAVDADFRDIEE